MSDVVEAAVKALNAKLNDGAIDGSVKFVIEDEGALVIDADGARPGDADADCTMTASAETFQGILDGDLDPTAAFMTGRLKIDGDMGLAMRLGSILG